MKNYSIVKTKKFALQNMKLISLREEDIEKIRIWRNQQRSILRQNKIITKKEQENYFNTVIVPTFEHSLYLLPTGPSDIDPSKVSTTVNGAGIIGGETADSRLSPNSEKADTLNLYFLPFSKPVTTPVVKFASTGTGSTSAGSV